MVKMKYTENHIFNAWKRENLQRNQIQKGLTEANKEDWIIISDVDEIPNLSKIFACFTR